MPSKHKTSEGTTSVAELWVPAEFLGRLVKGPMTQDEAEAVCWSRKKVVIERVMGAELSQHHGYAQGEAKPIEQANHRNGRTGKTASTDNGPVRIELPRDRAGSFEPWIIPKRERRFTGFDEKIVAMYFRGMTVREIHVFSGRDERHRGVAGVHQHRHQ